MGIGDVDCLVLCGGMGTRLRTVIGEHQKVMADAGGRPFLDLILEDLRVKGIRRVVLCTGYDADQVEEYYGKHDMGLEIAFSRETSPLGTGGAVKLAGRCVRSENFIVINGDSWCDIDLKAMFTAHIRAGRIATIAVTRCVGQDRKDYGGIDVDADGRITVFGEKNATPVGEYVNAGVYCFRKDVFGSMPEHEKFSLEYELFPRLVNAGMSSFIVENHFYDIGTPERLDAARHMVRERSKSHE